MADTTPGQGNAERLHAYWGVGEGAKQIRWGTNGDHDRCVRLLVQHAHFTEGQAHGYCNLMEKRVTGQYPAQHAQQDRARAAVFDSALHPRVPPGTGGGQFAPAGQGQDKGGKPPPPKKKHKGKGQGTAKLGQGPGRRPPPLPDGAKRLPVKSGDTLSQIALAHGTTVADIMAANPQIDDADLIYAGENINLPVPPGKAKPPTLKAPPRKAPKLVPAAAEPALPALVTIPNVDLVAAGTWKLSSGEQTFTTADLAAAVTAAQCPAVGAPVIKLGHVDPRFDGEPALGHVLNMRLAAEGNKVTGDLAGMPGWLGVTAKSAYPSRSIEGMYGFTCQIGHEHPFVITGLALLGVTPPGVGVLSGLPDVAGLYGVAANAAAGRWTTQPLAAAEGTPIVVTEAQVRRAFYAAEETTPSEWITELQMNPSQVIVADQATNAVWRVPFTIEAGAVTFGDRVQVTSTYADVAAARGTGAGVVFGSAEESRSGVEPEAPEVDAAAATHAPCTATHDHPHPAMGDQGGDATHEHPHTHGAGGTPDANHAHAHAGAGPNQGGSDVQISTEQLAQLRARLGLNDNTEPTFDQIMAALGTPAGDTATGTPPATDPAAPPTPEPVAAAGPLPAGVVAVDQRVWEATQAQIRLGVQARQAQLRNDRDTELSNAVKAGKFPVSEVGRWEQVYDANPEAARQILARLTPGTVPVDRIGAAGEDPQGVDDEFAGLWPPQPVRR